MANEEKRKIMENNKIKLFLKLSSPYKIFN